jgi:hypothetical protein
MTVSRLREHQQKQAIRNIILISFGIIFFLFLVLNYGMQFLINFSVIIDKAKSSSEKLGANQDTTYIAPPVLDAMQSATNSAQVSVSGYSEAKQSINLYVNGKFIKKTNVKDDKTFLFKDVSLANGENYIKAKTITDVDKQSDYSNQIIVMYNNKAPSIDISFPSDGQTFSKEQNQININGTTDSGNKITVNDYRAIIDDQGKFSYLLKLQNGDNKIKIDAIDDAGNKTTKEIKVIYSP